MCRMYLPYHLGEPCYRISLPFGLETTKPARETLTWWSLEGIFRSASDPRRTNSSATCNSCFSSFGLQIHTLSPSPSPPARALAELFLLSPCSPYLPHSTTRSGGPLPCAWKSSQAPSSYGPGELWQS